MKAKGFSTKIRADTLAPGLRTAPLPAGICPAIYLALMSTTEAPFGASNTETAILSRLIESARGALAPEAAGYILSLEFKQSDVRRMNELADKARDGALSPAEAEEVENYRHVGHLLALSRSKARASLKQPEIR